MTADVPQTHAHTHALTLACRDVAPQRGGRVVAAGMTFTLAPGAALVLRGENGSGKTSALRAVAGLCRYGGEVSFTDRGAAADAGAARADRMHLLGGGDGLTARLTAREHVAFWAGLYGVPEGGALDRIGLADAASRPAGALSTGQRRRLGLARLLMAPRAVWLLDEPFSGLDAKGRALLLDAADAHRASGGSVLMATHEEGLPGAGVLRLA